MIPSRSPLRSSGRSSVRTAVAALLLCGAAIGQGRIEVLATGIQPYTEAKIAPSGVGVAFRGSDRLGVIDIAPPHLEYTVATGPNLGEFIWAPSSAGIFYVERTPTTQLVKFVGRTGGASVTIATSTTSTTIQLGSATSTHVYGSRYAASTNTYHVFKVALTGGGIVDVLSSADFLEDVRLDPSEQFLLVRTSAAFPFAPVSYLRIGTDGTNPIDIAGVPVGVFAENGDWLDAGDTIFFDGVDPDGAGLQVLRVNRTAQVVQRLTGRVTHQRASIAPFRQLLAFESVDLIGGNSPAVLPAQGGALVQLDVGVQYQYTSSPTIDSVGSVVVFSARNVTFGGLSNLYVSRLQELLYIEPRAELNATVNFTLPVPLGFVGAILISAQPRPAPLVLPNATYAFLLDDGFSFFAAGPESNGRFVTQLPIPPIPLLVGLGIFVQGLHIDPVASTGGFSQRAWFEIR